MLPPDEACWYSRADTPTVSPVVKATPAMERVEERWNRLEGLGEATQGGVVEARPVIHQAQRGEVALEGVAEVGAWWIGTWHIGADLAEGQVALLGSQGAAAVGDGDQRAEVVAQEIL